MLDIKESNFTVPERPDTAVLTPNLIDHCWFIDAELAHKLNEKIDGLPGESGNAVSELPPIHQYLNCLYISLLLSLGTALYRAPEIIDARNSGHKYIVSPSADIWSWCYDCQIGFGCDF